MSDKSYALGPTLTGFDCYCDVVRGILRLYVSIVNGIYDRNNNGGEPLDAINDSIEAIANLTLPTASGPTGYNIDNEAVTQALLLESIRSVKVSYVKTAYAEKIARNVVLDCIQILQKHLVDLINESTSYSDINDYYNQNQVQRSSVDNILNGGYHFTSDWNALSSCVGVPYSSTYDIG